MPRSPNDEFISYFCDLSCARILDNIAAARTDGDSGRDGQSAVAASEDGNPASDAGATSQGDTAAAGTKSARSSDSDCSAMGLTLSF